MAHQLQRDNEQYSEEEAQRRFEVAVEALSVGHESFPLDPADRVAPKVFRKASE
jgi:hypothetical protein